MVKVSSWIKSHKLVLVLIVVILYLIGKSSLFTSRSYINQREDITTSSKMSGLSSADSNISGMMPSFESAPVANVKDRLVVKNSYLSLQVSKVEDFQKQVIQKAEELGGYMVNSYIDNPSDAASASVTIRIPSKQLDSALEYYRSLSIRVVSENLQGYDVTDQYVDFASQLKTYEKTKVIFENLIDKATNVQSIIQIQQEIIRVQASIDSIKGQQDYLKKNSEMAKITLYLSTDELALPYAPTETWRPGLIFKQAVRSLVGSLRNFGTLIIWLTVYSVLLVPIFLIILLIRRRVQTKQL